MEKIGSSLEYHEAEISIREAAADLNDEKMLLKIGHYTYRDGPYFLAKEAMYHHTCRHDYLARAKKVKLKTKKEVSACELRKRAFNDIINYIKINVIYKDQPEMASSLLKLFKDAYTETGGTIEEVSYNVQNSANRLKVHFQIQI